MIGAHSCKLYIIKNFSVDGSVLDDWLGALGLKSPLENGKCDFLFKSKLMDALEDARQDKLNAQNEFNLAKDEFKSWKDLNGIQPKDEVYLELKQAVLAANDNFNKARDIYNRLINGQPSLVQSEPKVASSSKATNQQPKTVKNPKTSNSLPPSPPRDLLPRQQSSSRPAGQEEQIVCANFKLVPPKVTPNLPKSEDYLKFGIKPILIVICLFSILFDLDLMSRYEFGLGIPSIIFSVIGFFAVFTSNLDYIAAHGWLKLFSGSIQVIVMLLNGIPRSYYPGTGTCFIAVIIRIFITYAYLYVIQKYYMSIAKDEEESLLEEGLQWDQQSIN